MKAQEKGMNKPVIVVCAAVHHRRKKSVDNRHSKGICRRTPNDTWASQELVVKVPTTKINDCCDPRVQCLSKSESVRQEKLLHLVWTEFVIPWDITWCCSGFSLCGGEIAGRFLYNGVVHTEIISQTSLCQFAAADSDISLATVNCRLTVSRGKPTIHQKFSNRTCGSRV